MAILPLPVIFVFILISICRQTSEACGYNENRIDLHPHSVLVMEGDVVRLNCTVRYWNLTGVVSFGSVINGKLNDSVHPGTSLQLSPSSSQLVIANVSMAEDNISIYCRVGQIRSDCVVIRVFRHPLTPVLSGCVVSNWAIMNCTWTPSSIVQFQHTNRRFTTTLESCQLRDESIENSSISTCSQITFPTSDFIPNKFQKITLPRSDYVWNNLALDAVYCMRVRVALNNVNLVVLSKWSCVRPSEHVQPQPPTDLSHVTRNLTHVTIKWRMKFRMEVRDFMAYRITMTSDLQQEETIVTAIVNTTEITLPVIWPHTNHRVSIQAKPTESGYWSDSSVPYEFTSLPSVPCRQPQVAPHVFYSQDSVYLYWQSVPGKYQCGTNFFYLVVFLQPSHLHQRNETVNETMISISTRSLLPASSVAVRSCTDQGCNTTDTYSVVNITPTTPGSLQYQFKVLADGANRTIRVHLLSADNRRLSNSTLITVYWCLIGDRPHACANDLKWRQLTAAQFSWSTDDVHSISLNVEHYFKGYRVGVAVQDQSLQWASCINKFNGSTSSPSDVTLTAVTSGLFNAKLQVKWTSSACEHSSGLVTSYLIKYCVVGDDLNCRGEELEVTERAFRTDGTSYSLILGGLDPDTSYGVRVYSCSGSTRSRRPKTFVAKTAFGLSVGGLVVLVTCALVIAVITLVAMYFVRRSWQRCKWKHQNDFAIQVPDVPISTVAETHCDDEHMTSHQVYSSFFTDIWTTRTVSSDSGCHDEQLTSPLLSTSTDGCDRQISNDSSRTMENDVFADTSVALTSSVASDAGSYVEVNTAIGSLLIGSYVPLPRSALDVYNSQEMSCAELGTSSRCGSFPPDVGTENAAQSSSVLHTDCMLRDVMKPSRDQVVGTNYSCSSSEYLPLTVVCNFAPRESHCDAITCLSDVIYDGCREAPSTGEPCSEYIALDTLSVR